MSLCIQPCWKTVYTKKQLQHLNGGLTSLLCVCDCVWCSINNITDVCNKKIITATQLRHFFFVVVYVCCFVGFTAVPPQQN
jgi:hypothetical protein